FISNDACPVIPSKYEDVGPSNDDASGHDSPGGADAAIRYRAASSSANPLPWRADASSYRFRHPKQFQIFRLQKTILFESASHLQRAPQSVAEDIESSFANLPANRDYKIVERILKSNQVQVPAPELKPGSGFCSASTRHRHRGKQSSLPLL